MQLMTNIEETADVVEAVGIRRSDPAGQPVECTLNNESFETILATRHLLGTCLVSGPFSPLGRGGCDRGTSPPSWKCIPGGVVTMRC